MTPQPITCKAAVAFAANTPLEIISITVAPPKEHEVRIKVLSNALCHTDLYTLSGLDPEGNFPCILGHEAIGIIESVGPNVTSFSIGERVIPCYTPQCKKCEFCLNGETNLCPIVRNTQGKGVMSDGTSRFSYEKGQIYHFMGCSTLSEYTVISEYSAAKVGPLGDANRLCMLGCGVSTGWGAVYNTCKVKPNTTAVIFGLGAVGLAVVQACKELNCKYIVGIDINNGKFDMAKKLGCHDCFNSKEIQDIKGHLIGIQKWGYDYTFDCTGNTDVMRIALEIAHRGWGQSCVIGVAASGKEISTRPFQLVTGRQWKGTAFGGWKSKEDVPKLVQKVLLKELDLDCYVSNIHKGLEFVNEGFHNLHEGKILRDIIQIDKQYEFNQDISIKIIEQAKQFGGINKQISHFSQSCQTEMLFSIFLPNNEVNKQRGKLPNTLYFLAGLTSSDENPKKKSFIQNYAKKHNLAIVFCPTSPYNTGLDQDWTIGEKASFYLDANSEKYKQFQMFTYITQELPKLVESFFPVSHKKSITGHSMGGHGALIAALKTQNYASVSAFAPICDLKNIDWGKKAFKEYQVEKPEEWTPVDLIKARKSEIPVKVDIGTHDGFWKDLRVETLQEVLREREWEADVQIRDGYGHGYEFVSSFVEEHVDFHAKYLNL